jgi:hypothetical protein
MHASRYTAGQPNVSTESTLYRPQVRPELIQLDPETAWLLSYTRRVLSGSGLAYHWMIVACILLILRIEVENASNWLHLVSCKTHDSRMVYVRLSRHKNPSGLTFKRPYLPECCTRDWLRLHTKMQRPIDWLLSGGMH